ncbi:hypothetical protein MTR_4g046847 [Medicago truncatula]|uniref:Uncharacterized protein n=1 Tax=Medicago truncatula TaxID=3880 RepID=A0A072UJQ7_MEDTR|nr:hypothetical protein MTR_4g046847 [Medicago truncatula]
MSFRVLELSERAMMQRQCSTIIVHRSTVQRQHAMIFPMTIFTHAQRVTNTCHLTVSYSNSQNSAGE